MIKPWKDLTISNDFMFQQVMRNKALCKQLLEQILNFKIADLHYPENEKRIKPRYDQKGIRLDVYTEDGNQTAYDVEMQTGVLSDETISKRMRYYQGLIDLNNLESGEYYDALKPLYIIFICTFDPYKAELPVYTIKEKCLEHQQLDIGTEVTKIVLNASAGNKMANNDLAAFLRYVNGDGIEGEFVAALDQEVQRIKSNKKLETAYMTFEMKLIGARREGFQEGKAEGKAEGKQEMIIDMLKQNLNLDLIAAVSKWPLSKIIELQAQLNLSAH